MTSLYLVHYKVKRKFLFLFDRVLEGSMEVEIENHDHDSLTSKDIEVIEELVIQDTKAYEATILHFSKMSK